MRSLTVLSLIAALVPSGSKPDDMSLLTLHAADRRVADVSWQLARSNSDLCEIQKSGMGWLLHSLDQYSTEIRSELRRSFSLRLNSPIILAVPPGSPAQKAGLQEGDQIIAINDRSMINDDPEPSGPFYHPFSEELAEIDRELMHPQPYVEILRGSQVVRLPLHPELQCALTVQVEATEATNARADARVISVDWGLVSYAEAESELAILIGHELAHVISYNADTSVWDRAVEATPRGLFRRERAADRLGLYLAARAGYDVTGAADFWRRFGRVNLRARWTQWGHPSANARADALEAVIADIAGKQRAGQELLP